MTSFFRSEKRGDHDGKKGGLPKKNGANNGNMAKGLQVLYAPEKTEESHIRDVADVLVEMGKLNSEQLGKVHQEDLKKNCGNLEQLIMESGAASAEDVLMAKAKLYGFEFRHIEPPMVDREAFDKLNIHYVQSNHIMAVEIKDQSLIVATSDPANVFAIDDVKRQTNMSIATVLVCMEEDIKAACKEFDDSTFGYDVDEIMNDMGIIEVISDEQDDTEDLEKSAGESPVIKFVNYLVSNALHEGASDIHIEPKEKYTKVRYRIDGVLFDMMQAPAKMHPAVVSRLKIMANLDISERRTPQDGKIAVRMGGRGIDLRVSVLPTSHGEKVVIRILDSQAIMKGLDTSGMEKDVLSAFLDQVNLPNGILLVTGPTGSGKSTTLYSALGQMESDELNVSTVEDPVEYNLEFCNQVQVNEKTGMTFAGALRSLLRQDPDIIMLGEIRDNETARVAVQAALTGHLVLSTLHTNDAPSSISRLVDIGIEPYLIAASLNAILAQRLVRRICPNCKENYKAPDNVKKYLDIAGVKASQLVRGVGCDQCRESGYQGRAGIFELLIINDMFRRIINKDPSVNSMRDAFMKSEQASLFDDGMIKVKQGVTTVEEVLRVTQVYGQSEDEVFTENFCDDRPSKTKTKAKKLTAKEKKDNEKMLEENGVVVVGSVDEK